MDIYDMELLESRDIYSRRDQIHISVMRVPGGWIINKVFVPFDNEFQGGSR